MLHGSRFPVGVEAATVADQRAALVELYTTMNGDAWNSNSGWRDYGGGSDPCENAWVGVACSGTTGSANRNV
jgi:hypothetical protein